MPKPPKQLLEESLALIAARVSITEVARPPSHTVVEATGIDQPAVSEALARYAVGFLAGWVQRNATIGGRLGVEGPEKRDEIRRLVERIVVPPLNLDDTELENWRRSWRNAWIAEVLTHALFVVRRSTPSASLAGSVVALLRPHPLPKRQGLDTVAIYEDSAAPVITVGETKATPNNGSSELTHACDMFDDVEAGLHGPDLRDAIDLLADVLPDHLANQVEEGLWRGDCPCFVPAIVHETAFNAATSRPRLARLQPPAERKRVLLLQLATFDAFFDVVAQAMPPAVDELVV